MATHDYDIANQSGANFRADLNNCLDAIVSNNSNSSDPSTTFAYMWWVDTSNDILKIRNSANNAWIDLPMSITTSNTISPTLNMGTGAAEDVKIVFDGNAQDFYIALDDSADDLLIGKGSTVGTTPAIAIDENLLTTLHGGLTMVGTTPTLTIGDGGEEDTKIVFDGNAQDYYIGLDDSADDLIIGKGSAVGTTPAIAINENEDVCINGSSFALAGGASSYGNLTINGASGGILEFANDGVLQTLIQSVDTSFQLLHQTDAPALFGVNNAEAFRINSGNRHLLVGTTTEYTGTNGNLTVPLQLDIGANDTNSKYVFVNRGASTGIIGGFRAGVTGFSQMGRVELQADNVGGGAQTSSFHVYTTLNATEAEKMQIDGSGNVFFPNLFGSAADQNDVRYNPTSGLLFYNTSSRRYKENIKDMSDGVLEKVKQAKVVTFDEKETGVSSYGLIAEDLNEIIPELVVKREIDGEEVPDSIVYSKIGVWVLKAMQEQQDIIDNLKTRIETLEGA